MDGSDPLTIDYDEHRRVGELIDFIVYCLEDISLGFERWDDEYVRGPGLYIAIVAGTSVAEYADPMGDDRWPADRQNVLADGDGFYEAASQVAMNQDGAVVVSVDGVVQTQMVRFRDLPVEDRDDLAYADWMGSRHRSAVDISAREEVVAAVTLSEETGRVTAFEDGTFEDRTRGQLGGAWRVGDY